MSAEAKDLLKFVDKCPTPWHATAHCAATLGELGYEELIEAQDWSLQAGGKYFLRRSGSIVAFAIGKGSPVEHGIRMIGAHTDSPNLRLKPNPLTSRSGNVTLGVEPYGGVLLHTWLDRDLTLAGRLYGQDRSVELFQAQNSLLRIPSLAIHLNRTVNKEGLKLNAQKHLPPLFSLGNDPKMDALLNAVNAKTKTPLGSDICVVDTQPSSLSGANDEYVHAPRLDNLASCHASLRALANSADDVEHTRLIALYDHEECGSRSAHGAQSNFLYHAVERLCDAFTDRHGLAKAMPQSILMSADMAHAQHPNFIDKHDKEHAPILGKGPVLKVNYNQSYATDGEGMALFRNWCEQSGVPMQVFVTRSDSPCGSTIGPITSARLSVRTFDVGGPMLSMHSCREMMASSDVAPMINVMSTFLADPSAPIFG